MDHVTLTDARKKAFRRPLGIDKRPNAPSTQECLAAINLGLYVDNRGPRDKKDLTNIVDRWVRANGSQLDASTRQELTTRFKAVHNAWKDIHYLKFMTRSSSVEQLFDVFQGTAQNFLEYAQAHIRDITPTGYERLDKHQQIAYEKAKTVIGLIQDEAKSAAERTHHFDQRMMDIKMRYEAAQQFELLLHNLGRPIPQVLTDYKKEEISNFKALEEDKAKFTKDYMGYLEKQYGKFFAIYEADRLATKEFWRALSVATTKFLNAAGIKSTYAIDRIILGLLKTLVEGKI